MPREVEAAAKKIEHFIPKVESETIFANFGPKVEPLSPKENLSSLTGKISHSTSYKLEKY